MWPWKRKAAVSESPDVRETLDELKRDIRRLRLEWEDTYDKLLHLMRRLTKRDERAAANGDAPPNQEPPAEHGYPGLGNLTPEQRKAQIAILQRRSRVQAG